MSDYKSKQLGQIFTPAWIVTLILDRVGYSGEKILSQYVFEPGCGDGAFLGEIVTRYISEARRQAWDPQKISQGLSEYVYGVEVDEDALRACINLLNSLIAKEGVPPVMWHVTQQDILDVDVVSIPKFDYVVGNPPYVRIHNLNKKRLVEIKERFVFCRTGIIDLFLVFFEVGLSVLSPRGVLGFITPNSFIHNSTYSPFRAHIADNHLLKELIDFKHVQVFHDASTYNAVTLLSKEHASDVVEYYECGEKGDIHHVNTIHMNEQNPSRWSFGSSDDTVFLHTLQQAAPKIKDVATVQYGFATLRDKIFVINNSTKKRDGALCEIEPEMQRSVVKGSTYDGGEINEKILYPYIQNKEGKWVVIPESELQEKYPKTYRYLVHHKQELMARSLDRGALWYEYGRSQGVQTIHHEKLVISPVFKDTLRVYKIPADVMVYSGVYLFMNSGTQLSLEDIKGVITGGVFIKYARLLGKDMQGGYKNINTKVIKDFPV